jgi:1-acyl-sn-glycerol-3-phosphate acyltransferase
MARQATAGPLHVELLKDPEQLLRLSDQSAQELIDLVRPEGYFGERGPEELRWPPNVDQAARPIGPEGLHRRIELVGSMYRGVPALRDERLAEAWQRLRDLTPAYREAARIYLGVRREFVSRDEGSEDDFLRLYQTLYVEALATEELQSQDLGEASLERAHLARVPLSHAQAVAVALPQVQPRDDPRWEATYELPAGATPVRGTLRELLTDVAGRTLDFIAAGELFATRFNTYHNFGWFGSSVWKVVVDADALRHRLRERGGTNAAEVAGLEQDLLRAQAMMIEFLRAHTEDPARLKPAGYWYGQEYSYLTRDMIDLTHRIVARARALERGDSERAGDPTKVALPPLLAGTARERFLVHPQASRRGRASRLARTLRLARWTAASWRLGRRRLRLARKGLGEAERRQRAWEGWLDWADATLRIFGIEVDVRIDPDFETIARELDLARGGRKVLFLPTHQSLFDHPVMYRVLGSPELMAAMGWERPVPCVILARTGMALAGVKVGRWSMTMFGCSSGTFDRLLEELDGYVTLERSGPSAPTTTKVAAALGTRPGVVYPMATTAAFESQLFPLQHALFAQLPADVVVVPVALRGIHQLWPKCPKGNLDISPGRVEAYVSPPVLGETTLLPKRRSLRIQMETAALFQAIQITTLLDPEPSRPDGGDARFG